MRNKKPKVYALKDEADNVFNVYATFYGHHPGLNEREEAARWLDSNGTNMAREMGSTHEDRASVSGCCWEFKTATQANAFGRKLNTCAPPCVTIMLGDSPDEPAKKNGK
jgi:hypothetical protein